MPLKNATDVLPAVASVDCRIGEMTAIKVGLKYAHQVNNGYLSTMCLNTLISHNL
ncbi:MAG: hypothetical protein ACJAYN_001697 [Bermanella sp.]|jgi:hypothetical protein